MNSNPLVSICCITYNHAQYIRQCLDGILMQKVDFEYEIIVHDDASTDGTSAIIKEYFNKYPNLFVPIFQTENQYSKGVRGMYAKFVFPRARGKYIALCEGDDYWIDENKLQMQVDFLEKNPECAFVCSNRYTLKSNNRLYKDRILTRKYISLNSVIGGFIPHTASVVFNKSIYYNNTPINCVDISGDRLLAYNLLKKSSNIYGVHFRNRYVVYRDQGQGVWCKDSKKVRKEVMFKNFVKYGEIFGLQENKYFCTHLVVLACSQNRISLLKNHKIPLVCYFFGFFTYLYIKISAIFYKLNRSVTK